MRTVTSDRWEDLLLSERAGFCLVGHNNHSKYFVAAKHGNVVLPVAFPNSEAYAKGVEIVDFGPTLSPDEAKRENVSR